jgi:hypothetical protein
VWKKTTKTQHGLLQYWGTLNKYEYSVLDRVAQQLVKHHFEKMVISKLHGTNEDYKSNFTASTLNEDKSILLMKIFCSNFTSIMKINP